MFFKVTILACVVALCRAGVIGQYAALPAVPALPAQYAIESPVLTATSDNVIRSPGNLAQISSHAKTIQTPFSSSSKSDVRISNPGVYAHYAAPAAPLTYAAAAPTALAHPISPVAHSIAAPPSASLLGVAYSPAVAVSHMAYHSPIGVYSY